MNVRLTDDAFMPERAHGQDAGLDLRAPKGYIVYPNGERKINTGVAISLPKDTVGYVKGRSSLFQRGIGRDEPRYWRLWLYRQIKAEKKRKKYSFSCGIMIVSMIAGMNHWDASFSLLG